MLMCGECDFFQPDVVDDAAYRREYGIGERIGPLGGCHAFYTFLSREHEDDLALWHTIEYRGNHYVVISGEFNVPSLCPLFVPDGRRLTHDEYVTYRRGGDVFPDCITLNPSKKGGKDG